MSNNTSETGFLLPHHRGMLHASAISDQVLAERGYFTAARKVQLGGSKV